MAEMSGPIMYQTCEVVRAAGKPNDFLLLITDAAEQQHGVPLTRGQAQLIADRLNAALKQG